MEDNLMMNQDDPSIEESTGAVVDGSNDGAGMAREDDPHGVKKRLGQQAKKHEREMRALKDQIASMHSRLAHSNNFDDVDVSHPNSFNSPGQPSGPNVSEEDRIRRAVRYALEAKDAETQRQKNLEAQAHVGRHYQRLESEFSKASDKYDDFDDVVMGDHVPFTPAIRDALLLIGNPADVAYKLGKNVDELSRIAKLHPLDQAREVNQLSVELMQGNNGKKSEASNSFNPLQANKPNPTSGSVTDKTSASNIRARMKAGTWK